MQSNEANYWLLPGETPIGPYRADEILAQIQAGSCTWTTKACLVGSQTWAPLNQLLTLAPVATLATGSETPGASTVDAPTPPSQQAAGNVFSSHGVGILIVAAVGVCIWLWVSSPGSSSLTPQQVCQAFFSTKNATEARKYVTPNLYTAVDMVMSQPDFGSDSNEYLELSTEQTAPAQAGGGYYVGYRVHFKEAGNIVIIQGIFHVLDQSGWKVHDWYIFSVNGQSIEPPISLAREYEFFRDPQSPAVATRQMTDAKLQAQQSYRNNKALTTVAGYALVKGGLGKWLLGIIAVAGVAIVGFFKNQQASPSKPTH